MSGTAIGWCIVLAAYALVIWIARSAKDECWPPEEDEE